MTKLEHNLFINHITYGESVPPFNKNFDDYMKMAYLCLNHKGSHLFEQDILSHYSKDMTLEKLFAQNPDRFVQGINKLKDGIRQKVWYDLWGNDEIVKDDTFFDYFFICKLRHQSLLDIDGFLSFHLDYSFKNQKQEYFRFLQLSIRQYKATHLNDNIIETVQEWIKTNGEDQPKSEQNITGPDKKIKGRKPREANDRATCLTQVQTSLLIVFLQRAGMILADDTLNFTQIGSAFHILTGYSPETLRMQVGSKNIIDNAKFEDFQELHESVLLMASLIEAHTRKK